MMTSYTLKIRRILLASVIQIGFYGCNRMPDSSANVILNPLDTIPILSNPKDFEHGYYRLLRSDSSVAAIFHACNDKDHGVALAFYQNGFLNVYEEYDHGVPGVKITYNEYGLPWYCFPEKGSMLIFDGLDSIPPSIQARLNFIDSNCISLDKINWSRVLVNKCN